MAEGKGMFRKLLARHWGPQYVEHRTREGWTGDLPFYMVYCPTHGYYEDYPHGHKEYFTCPECGAAAQSLKQTVRNEK